MFLQHMEEIGHNVVDPHHVDPDPDPACHFDADPDPDPTSK